MQQHPENQQNPMAQMEMMQTIQDSLTCRDVCIQTARSCQQSSGEHARPDHIHMLEDCADLCQAAAHFMQHTSPLYGYVTRAATQVTTHCGEECARMGDTDCANACKTAAQALDHISQTVSF